MAMTSIRTSAAKVQPRRARKGASAADGHRGRVPGQAPRQRTRQGKKTVTYYLEPATFVALKVLSARTGRTLQELNEEAVELLFDKHAVTRP